MASSQKKRCDWPSFAAVPTQVEPTINKIRVSTRSRRPSSFLRGALRSSTFCSARSNSLAIVARENLKTALGHDYLLGLFLRWRLGSKFLVSNLAAGVGNVAAHSENNCAEQNRADNKRG